MQIVSWFTNFNSAWNLLREPTNTLFYSLFPKRSVPCWMKIFFFSDVWSFMFTFLGFVNDVWSVSVLFAALCRSVSLSAVLSDWWRNRAIIYLAHKDRVTHSGFRLVVSHTDGKVTPLHTFTHLRHLSSVALEI